MLKKTNNILCYLMGKKSTKFFRKSNGKECPGIYFALRKILIKKPKKTLDKEVGNNV